MLKLFVLAPLTLIFVVKYWKLAIFNRARKIEKSVRFEISSLDPIFSWTQFLVRHNFSRAKVYSELICESYFSEKRRGSFKNQKAKTDSRFFLPFFTRYELTFSIQT